MTGDYKEVMNCESFSNKTNRLLYVQVDKKVMVNE